MNRVHMTYGTFDTPVIASEGRSGVGMEFSYFILRLNQLSESDTITIHKRDTCLHREDILESSAGPHEVHVHPYAIQHFQLVWTGNPETHAIGAAVDSRPQEKSSCTARQRIIMKMILSCLIAENT